MRVKKTMMNTMDLFRPFSLLVNWAVDLVSTSQIGSKYNTVDSGENYVITIYPDRHIEFHRRNPPQIRDNFYGFNQ